MPSKRTPLRRQGRRIITQEAVDAFKAGDHRALRDALQLMPWEFPDPIDIDREEVPAYARGSGLIIGEWWPECWALRQELERLAGDD
jgi:hypothetical protein